MARRSRRKARYSVDMSVKAWDLAKAGSAIEIAIRDRDVLLGTIQIGQGGFRWHPAHGKKGFKRIRWSKLAEDLNDRYRNLLPGGSASAVLGELTTKS